MKVFRKNAVNCGKIYRLEMCQSVRTHCSCTLCMVRYGFNSRAMGPGPC